MFYTFFGIGVGVVVAVIVRITDRFRESRTNDGALGGIIKSSERTFFDLLMIAVLAGAGGICGAIYGSYRLAQGTYP
uniref:Uncharacterized protein n=1 Tax=viral metagenome TaxID=1070528 RepID=A0A6C0C6F7_9ZZZZ